MRKLTMMMSLLLTLGSFCACSSDDDMNGFGNGGTILVPRDSLAEERFKSVPEYDYTGRLHYEEWLNTWAISYYHPGSIDRVDIYYPMNLPDELRINKEERIDVSFSGKVIEMTDEDIKTQQIVLLGGYHYYYVYLTKIEKVD